MFVFSASEKKHPIMLSMTQGFSAITKHRTVLCSSQGSSASTKQPMAVSSASICTKLVLLLSSAQDSNHSCHERRFGVRGVSGSDPSQKVLRSTFWGADPPKPLNAVQRDAHSDTGACHRASRSSLRSRVAPRWRRRHPVFFNPATRFLV